MNSASQSLGAASPQVTERFRALEADLRALAERTVEQAARLEALEGTVKQVGQTDRLSLCVFSGSLDRLIASFVLATGAAAMGTEVSMFFTFWGTAALRKPDATVKKTIIERMFGWMLPKGTAKLPLSQMNMAGGGPAMIRHIMKKKGVASVDEMIQLAGELGVKLNVCTMSMDLLGFKPEELIDYPGGVELCGVATFLETSAPGKMTLFL